jgi:hypothetical protein
MQARRRLDAGYRRLVFGGRGRPLAAARRSPLEDVEKFLTTPPLYDPQSSANGGGPKSADPSMDEELHNVEGRFLLL